MAQHFAAKRLPVLTVLRCMKVISAAAGLGEGVKDLLVSLVFEDEEALTQFLDSGWLSANRRARAVKGVANANADTAELLKEAIIIGEISRL
jgi:hypothetical protein